MNKILLEDDTELEFNKIEGLRITFTNKVVEDLEKVFTKENCKQIKLITETQEVYGIYNNLECISITKNLEDNTITVTLKKLNTLEIKVEQLQATVDSLVVSGLEG